MPVIIAAGRPQQPQVAQLTQQVVQLVLASATRASLAQGGVSNAKLPKDQGSLEQVFTELFGGTDSRSRLIRTAFRERRATTSLVPGGLKFDSRDSVVEQALKGGLIVSPGLQEEVASLIPNMSASEISDRLIAILRPRILHPPMKLSPTPNTTPARPEAKRMELVFKSLVCVERVGLEFTDIDGKDMILCGGVGWDSTLASQPPEDSASTAHFRKVPASRMQMGLFGRDGMVHRFNPDRVFCYWDLPSGNTWPRTFAAVVVLAEKDSGEEFSELVKATWEMLSPAVLAAVSALATAAIGGTVGAIVGTEVVPLIGTLIGAAVGAIMGAVIGIISETLKDDILMTPNQPFTTTAEGPADVFPDGSDESEVLTSEYVRNGGMPGVYHLRYYWRLVR